MRQKRGQALPFISLIEQEGSTDVLIDASELVEGDEFLLELESFDTNSSGIASTLKTDSIIIAVIGLKQEPPTFKTPLTAQ